MSAEATYEFPPRSMREQLGTTDSSPNGYAPLPFVERIPCQRWTAATLCETSVDPPPRFHIIPHFHCFLKSASEWLQSSGSWWVAVHV